MTTTKFIELTDLEDRLTLINVDNILNMQRHSVNNSYIYMISQEIWVKNSYEDVVKLIKELNNVEILRYEY